MSDLPQMPAGYSLQVFETIDSTNDELRRQTSNSDLASGTVIWSKTQTAGRGRQKRVWVSEPGNVFCSVLFKPECDLASAAQIAFLPVLAAADALSEILGKKAPLRFKWPNDLLFNRKKVAGVLLESSAAQDGSPKWVIAGCGINLASHPLETQFPATNVLDETGDQIADELAVHAYVKSLARWYEIWSNEGFPPVRERWLSMAHVLEEPLRVMASNEQITGAFQDLDEQGALILKTEEGARRITVGDVYFSEY